MRAVNAIPATVYHFSSFFLIGILSAITPKAGAVATTKSIDSVRTVA